MTDRKLTGKIEASRIRLFEVPEAPPGVLEGFRSLGDASGVVSDIFDELGITGVLSASTFRPTIAGACVVGTALTVRNIPLRQHPYEAAKARVNGMAEFEAHNLASPGNILVIDGVAGMSNIGGISAQTGKRQGEVGAIVQGGIRDLPHSRSVGYPLWSTEVTPVTGKCRLQTVEINGDIQMGGIRVSPGDIVLADDTGICFIPRARAAEVLALAQKKSAAEARKCKLIEGGLGVADLPTNA
ncbi:MAG: RraA family protein [Pseudomonadota bacterium]